MPPRKSKPKTHPRPVIVSNNAVDCIGEELSDPLLWQGRQWAVTGYGIEARDGTYPIRKERLGEDTWDEHMDDKGWVDMRDFRAALAWARNYFASAKPRDAGRRRCGNKRTGSPTRRATMPSVAELLS